MYCPSNQASGSPIGDDGPEQSSVWIAYRRWRKGGYPPCPPLSKTSRKKNARDKTRSRSPIGDDGPSNQVSRSPIGDDGPSNQVSRSPIDDEFNTLWKLHIKNLHFYKFLVKGFWWSQGVALNILILFYQITMFWFEILKAIKFFPHSEALDLLHYSWPEAWLLF